MYVGLDCCRRARIQQVGKRELWLNSVLVVDCVNCRGDRIFFLMFFKKSNTYMLEFLINYSWVIYSFQWRLVYQILKNHHQKSILNKHLEVTKSHPVILNRPTYSYCINYNLTFSKGFKIVVLKKYTCTIPQTRIIVISHTLNNELHRMTDAKFCWYITPVIFWSLAEWMAHRQWSNAKKLTTGEERHWSVNRDYLHKQD